MIRKKLLYIILLCISVATPAFGSSSIGLSIGHLLPSFSGYQGLLDSLGAEKFGQSTFMRLDFGFHLNKTTRVVLSAGRWVYDLRLDAPLSRRMPYTKWTVSLVPLTTSVEFSLSLPKSMFRPFLGVGAGLCIISEKNQLSVGDTQAGSTSTLLMHVYLGTELPLGSSIAVRFGLQRQFGKYEVIFEEQSQNRLQIGIGGSSMWAELLFYLQQR